MCKVQSTLVLLAATFLNSQLLTLVGEPKVGGSRRSTNMTKPPGLSSASKVLSALGMAIVLFMTLSLSLSSVGLSIDEDEGVGFLAQLGGPVTSMASKGSVLYVAVGARLQVFDISDVKNPALVQQIPPPVTAAYVEPLTHLTVNGDFACAVAGRQVVVFDVHQTATPSLLGSVALPQAKNAYIRDVALDPAKGRCFVAEVAVTGEVPNEGVTGNVHTISLDTPSGPALEKSSWVLGGHWDVESVLPKLDISNGHVYGYSTSWPGFLELTIVPRFLETLVISNTWQGDWEQAPVTHLAPVKDFLYLFSRQMNTQTHQMEIPIAALQVSSEGEAIMPDAPVLLLEGEVSNVALAEERLYVALKNGQVAMIDVADPATPSELGRYVGTESASLIHAADHYLFQAYDTGEIELIDISEPATPTISARIPISSYTVGSVNLVGGYLYSHITSDTVEVVDIFRASQPSVQSRVTVSELPTQLHNLGSYAYGIGNGLQIFDVSRPESPHNVGYPDDSTLTDLVVNGRVVFATTASEELRVYDLSNPAAPVSFSVPYTPEIGGIPYPPNHIAGIGLHADYAYVMRRESDSIGPREGHVDIFDLSDPLMPRAVGTVVLGETESRMPSPSISSTAWMEMVLARGILFITKGYHRGPPFDAHYYKLVTYKIIEPNILVPKTSQLVPAPYSLQTVGDLVLMKHRQGWTLYGSDGADGLVELAGGNQIIDMASQGKHLFLSAGSGLTILRSPPPLSTTIGLEGGILLSSPQGVEIQFGAATFPFTTTVTQDWMDPIELPLSGSLATTAYAFAIESAQSLTPTSPYTLSIQVTDEMRGTAISETLALYYWQGEKWAQEPTSQFAPASSTLTANPQHLGLFALLGETHRHYLPILMQSTSHNPE